MRKFSKIFESKETLLSKLGSSEDEIKDMCTELTDEGYEIKISTEYIGADGHIYYGENETSKYNPCIEVDLYRDTTQAIQGSQYNEKETKEQFKDVRKWNGGVYYEGNMSILKSVYELCYRFESTFTNGEAEVFFSMRSINEVRIRITFKLVESEGPIDFSEVNRYLGNQGLDLDDDYYDVEDSMTSDGGKTRSISIVHKDRSNKHETVKRILNSEIHSHTTKDDTEYLGQLVKEYVDRLFDVAKGSAKSALSLKVKGSDSYHDFGYYIMMGGTVLISIEGDFPIEDEHEIVVAKGIFKDRREKITIRSVDMDIKLNY